tara:strand:- start:3695 stop:3943 length:249 start_codon:yes stop_codon:yes gene_type:complete
MKKRAMPTEDPCLDIVDSGATDTEIEAGLWAARLWAADRNVSLRRALGNPSLRAELEIVALTACCRGWIEVPEGASLVNYSD